MFHNHLPLQRRGALLLVSLGVLLSFCLCSGSIAWAQQTQGTISVTVMDTSGAVLPGAQLVLVDLATNSTRTATAQDAGNYTFVNLNSGQYKLTVSMAGFATQAYDVLVLTARTTDVKAEMKVGSTQTAVQVEGGVAPLVEATTNAINTTIDTKQIEDLPLGTRNIAQLAQLAAGYNGTWNGLPSAALGSTVDGVVGNTTRWRYQSANQGATTAITPRLENIGEMVVSSDQIDMNQGFGTASMQITYVTRRGTNQFHGRVYEDFRSSALNAYNWGSKQRAKYHQNELGASVGGPIFKDKLFFFASFSALDVPGGSLNTRDYFANSAKTGVFTYGNGNTANIFNIITAYNAANPGTNLPTAVNTVVASRLAQVDQYRGTAGQQYSINPADPNLRTWQWVENNPQRTYYPTFRLDYDLSEKWTFNLSYNQTKFNAPHFYASHWAGDGRGAGQGSNNKSVALGIRTTITPTLMNQFKGGYLYTNQWFGTGGSQDFNTHPEIWYGYGNYDDYYELPNSRLQPIFSISDSVTWVKGQHTFNFGFNAFREVNKYWDPPEGYTQFDLALAEGDPALQAITKSAIQAAAGAGAPVPTDDELGQAQQLYATLAGRVSHMYGRHAYVPKTGTYAVGDTPSGTGVAYSTLNELLKSWGLFFQDSYKLKPNLTVNYGLRWDFISPDKDMTGKYHSMTPQDVFGPTGVGQLFQPGGSSLSGTNDPVFTARQTPYGSWNVTPQPAIGIAWQPNSETSFLGKLLGVNKTVVRAGFALRRFQEPQQFVWDMGSAYGIAFYQNFDMYPGTSGTDGTYTPGSINLSNWLPQSCSGSNGPVCLVKSPAQYDKIIHMNESTFIGGAAAGIKSDIRQPYTESWNFGIQRELGATRALEIRYSGNRTIHQWIAPNINEVNIYENGFLKEFNNAYANYKLNHAAGVESFANRGLPGEVSLPIMTAAGINQNSSTFINELKNGQVGTFAQTLANTQDYFCPLVGSSFGPCGSSYGAGAGYPVNFWMANPYAIGSWLGGGIAGGTSAFMGSGAQYMTDQGYSNYHALQVDFRQQQWHGLVMDANYTFSKTLGVATVGDWTGAYTQVTIRDIKSSYGPAGTDRNHVIHVNTTYDLPFGKGKQFLNQSSLLDKVIGGWTVSNIITFQSGNPFRVSGTNYTVNGQRDAGVVLNGISASDFTAHMGHYVTASGTPYFLDPAWVAQIKANGNIVNSNTPGQWGTTLWLHGPTQTYADIGISKGTSITERWKFKFQAEMLNAFNHAIFSQSTTSLTSSSFGRAATTTGYNPRRIELRANVEF